MKNNKLQYFIALGSNLNPENNIISMLNALFNIAEVVDISEIIRTEPVGLNSKKYFLNTVVRIETDKNRSDLKANLNSIEESLGRDRSNPDRKYKDRTADLDILFALSLETNFADKVLFEQEGFYIVTPLLVLLEHLNYKTNLDISTDNYQRIKLNYQGKTIGQAATQLNRQLVSK